MEAKDLVGKILEGWEVKVVTEVFNTDEDGRPIASLGILESELIAKGYAALQVDALYHKTVEVVILTKGNEAFELGRRFEVLDDEKAKLQIAQGALEKLSPEEAAALGISATVS